MYIVKFWASYFTAWWKLDLRLREKLENFYIMSIAFYGAKSWTLWKIDNKYLESWKCSAGVGWGRSFGPIL
jgi:hypothetical protein